MSATTLFFSLLGGVLPALLWLWFWLREDRLHPEPRSLILASFLAGMLAVLLALPAEQWLWNRLSTMTYVIIGWAVIEEVVKLGASYLGALRNRENNEPIDSLIYLITAALGFSALENTLFLVGAVKTGGFVEGLDLGVLRFVGATLLHVISSGALGFVLALGFCKRGIRRKLGIIAGLLLAIILHALFNLFILKSEGSATYTLTVFSFVWLAVALLLIGFEKVKQLKCVC